jgi:hypothetical protein
MREFVSDLKVDSYVVDEYFDVKVNNINLDFLVESDEYVVVGCQWYDYFVVLNNFHQMMLLW